MKTTNLTTVKEQLWALALRREYQRQSQVKPTAPKLLEDIDALILLLQVLYPRVSTLEEHLSSLLVLQRFLFAGALRAKEFLQLQQALVFLQQDDPTDGAALSGHAQVIRGLLDSFVPKELSLLWSGYPSEVLGLLVSQDGAASALSSFGVSGASDLVPRLVLLPTEECSARFLSVLSQSPDPERSLQWALSLLELPFGLGYFRFFCRRDAWLGALLRLTGLSEFLSRILLQNLDLFEATLLAASIRVEAPAMTLGALRHWQRQEQLVIVLGWLAERISLYETQRQFSSLAEACVMRCFEEALAEDAERHPRAAARMALIGLGSLGSYEMLYQSDLDLLFLSDGDEHQEERCTRIAQRTIALLSAGFEEGPLYEVDTRLRPLGTQGPLVASVQAWSRYFGLEESDGPRAQLWEEQALLRARPIHGDDRVLSIFRDYHRRVLMRPRVAQVVAVELRKMRQRLEVEAPKRRGFSYKAASGGLQDIDFLVQFLQLTHGDKAPALFCHTMPQALSLLSGAGLLTSQDSALLLSARERWLRWLLITRLLVEKKLDLVPENFNALRSLLRDQKISSDESFQKQLELLRGQVRACFDRVVV